MHLPSPNIALKSLKFKFLFLLLAILGLVAFGLSLVLISYQNNRQRQAISNSAVSFAKLSVRPIGNSYDTYFNSGFLKFKEILDANLKLDSSITKIQIIDVNGFILYDSTQKAQTDTQNQPKVDESLLPLVTSDKTEIRKDSFHAATEVIEPYVDDFGARPYSIRYFVNYDSLQESLVSTIPLALGVSLFVAILSTLLVIFTVDRTIITPVEKIVEGAKSVSRGNLAFRVELKTGDELENLASNVNKMATSLQKNIEDLKELDKLKDEFIIIASHNLRTPLTVLKGYVDSLNSKNPAIKPSKEVFNSMAVSVSKLENLVEEFLSIVSLESDRKISSQSHVDLIALVKQIISLNSSVALQKKIVLNLVSEQEAALIKGDLTKLKVAFNNLVENAIKFNKEGGSVSVSVGQEKENFVVSIKDTGIGIPEKEIPLVFKKFHRATDILEYNYQGLGLGLYLTRVIIEAHHGKVWFDSKADLGSTFYVSLPKEETQKGGE
ncbi:MAG TPA: HAMP domain-containing sensor histidine kinase [Candidatus Saccharimonadales bacterium]|nr:HAMP domain-containing sensor histidine kinase [Candidatus Saccharimonadales bacterium]